jgi:hypothetical protein
MARRSVAGLLAAEFFTQEYRISGYIDNRFKTVGDILNDRLESYVELGQVYISRISQPGGIVATYGDAQLRKDNLMFAIVPANERLSKVGRATSYFGTQLRRVWLALPTFEIEGGFQVTGLSLDWKAYLAKGVSDYVPLVEATARVTVWPEITFSGEAFLVNRAHIDLFCMEDEPA